MSALHHALKYLSPITYSDLPTDQTELEKWLSDLFEQSQVILDSIPISEPSESAFSPRSSSSSTASNASEISSSTARPPPPASDHQALQKEWGKPYKLGAKENALGMSVYKLGGKDGKGAWFARRSVHEGIAFSRFKKALEMEFPESLAVHGAPGEGNIRGIGGETKVEDQRIPSKGRIEVYRLSAQFPGPTTPRDFVTMLITSDNAIQAAISGEPILKHYLIVSKPCNHPDTQPQDGFIRGFYESVEFIREVPRQLQTSHSTSNLPPQAEMHDARDSDAILNPARQTRQLPLIAESATETKDDTSTKRSTTAPTKPTTLKDLGPPNPVEWIMVTRSDPGGSVPRFMVERGTPASICADAEKFLNWACQQDFDDEDVAAAAKDAAAPPPKPVKRESFQSFRSSRTAGLHDDTNEVASTVATHQSIAEEHNVENGSRPTSQSGLLGTAAQYLSSYTPQVVLDHLPGSNITSNNVSPEESKERLAVPDRDDDDAATTASFESADSHLTTSDSEPSSPSSSRVAMSKKPEEHLTHHEKELRKLEQRRLALENKFSESRTRLQQQATAQGAKEEAAKQKAAEKHERELKKQQEKHERELKKIDQKQERERKKLEAKKRKQADKDEKAKLTRERDEARHELDLLKKEADTLRDVVEELQKENTNLVAKLGKVGLTDFSGDESQLSRHDSKKKKERSHLNTESTQGSVKSA